MQVYIGIEWCEEKLAVSVHAKHVRNNPLGGRAKQAQPFSRYFLTTFACTR